MFPCRKTSARLLLVHSSGKPSPALLVPEIVCADKLGTQTNYQPIDLLLAPTRPSNRCVNAYKNRSKTTIYFMIKTFSRNKNCHAYPQYLAYILTLGHFDSPTYSLSLASSKFLPCMFITFLLQLFISDISSAHMHRVCRRRLFYFVY